MAHKATNRPFFLPEIPAFWMAVIAVATFVAYIPALSGLFTNWDDMVYIGGNPYIKSLSGKNLAAIFSTNYMGNYHPLAMLSLAVDYQINQFDPFVFHLTNLLIHIINSILVMIVLRQLTGKLELAAIAGLIFGVHTLHVESVAWISERKDVLYTCFYLLSMYSYLRFIPKKDYRWLGFSLLFFLLSNLSKGQGVTLAVSLFLVDLYKGRKLADIKVLAEKIPFLLAALIFGIVAIRAQEGADATIMANFPIQQRVAFASYGLVMYILKLIYPFSLSAYYPYPIIGNVGEVPLVYWLCIIPALAFLVFAVYSRKMSKDLFFGLAFFLVNIILLLQLLPVGRAIMADRYAYVPSIGFSFLAGYYLSDRRYIKAAGVAWGIVAVYVLLLMVLTFNRSKVWKNSETLWSDVLEKNPKVPVAWYNRGNTKMDSLNFQGAIEDYTECLKVDPGFWKAYINRGTARNKIQDYMGAVEDFDAMLRIDSTWANAYINRALSKRMLKDFEHSMKDYDRAMRLKPGDAELYAARANLKIDMRDLSGAIADFDEAIRINPNYATAYTNRGVVKKATNDLKGALADYNQAIRIDPGNHEFYNNRGNLKFQLGDFKGAIDDYSASIRINPKDFLGFKNRAAARMSLNLYKDALTDLNDGILINPKSGELHYTRSLVRKELGDEAGARADFLKAVELDPGYATSDLMKSAGLSSQDMPALTPAQFNEQGLNKEKAGQLQAAVDLYRKAVDMQPDYAEAWFNLGNVYGKMQRFSDAMNCLNNAIRYKGDYVEALSGRGIANASLGKTDQAIKDLTAAIRVNPDYAVAYLNRALVYLNTGKRDLACSDLRKAVQLGYSAAYPILQKECDGRK